MTSKTANQTLPSLLNVLRSARADLETFVARRIDGTEKRTTKAAKSVFRIARSIAKRVGGTTKLTR